MKPDKYTRQLPPDELRGLPIGAWWFPYGGKVEHRLSDITPIDPMLHAHRSSMCGSALINTSHYKGISDGHVSLNDGKARCKRCASYR
jgi:hypothetical protein